MNVEEANPLFNNRNTPFCGANLKVHVKLCAFILKELYCRLITILGIIKKFVNIVKLSEMNKTFKVTIHKEIEYFASSQS